MNMKEAGMDVVARNLTKLSESLKKKKLKESGSDELRGKNQKGQLRAMGAKGDMDEYRDATKHE